MPKQSKRNQKRSTSKRVTDKFRNLRWQSQLLAFAGVFALISGGYLIYQSFASDLIPKGSNELVLSYEIGMEHAMAPDDFETVMVPAALLYGNGLLLCSDQHAAGHTPGAAPEWRFQQLNRGEVQKLVSSVRSAKFDEAAAHQPGANGVLAPASSGKFIRLNTTEGITKASSYPNDSSPAFAKVEAVLVSKCAEATEAYTPDNVIVETIVLSDPALAATAEELPAELEIDPEPGATKRKELLGNEAKDIKSKTGTAGKVFKKEGKAVKARVLTKIPEYVEPEPLVTSSKGKVSAAAVQKTRWLIVLAEYQDRPAWASQDGLSNTASNIRSWYNREVGETFTIDGVSVVRGTKTRDQYKNCPNWAGTACKNQAQAIYYNMLKEFQKPGYSTNIIVPFEPNGTTLGLGSLANTFANDKYTMYYGTVGVTFAGVSNDRPKLTRSVAAHELGHNFGLSHRPCDSTLMASGCARPTWPDVRLYSGQASNLRRYSTFFP